MALAFFCRRGAQMPFPKNCTDLGHRAAHQLRCRPTTKLGFQPFGGRRSGYGGARRHIHQQAGPPPTDILLLRRLVVWPFIGVNILVYIKWQLANIDLQRQAEATVAAAGYQHRDPTSLIDKHSNAAYRHMVENYTLSLQNLQEGRRYTLLTCVASHEHLIHLVFNMISFNALAGLAILGGLPLSTILGLGVGSALASDVAFLYDFNRKGQLRQFGYGASGIISGMATALACTRPWMPFEFMFIPIPIPLWVLVLFYVGYETYGINSQQTGISHHAHLGGCGFGVLFYALFLRKYGGVIDILRRRR